MKILYICNGIPDYQCDALMHGLYCLLGEDLTHNCSYSTMYKQIMSSERLLKLYGRGFTIWGNLPEYLNDNSDLENKIKTHYFDFVIYGSIQRTKDYLELVKKYYKTSEICFVDGEDNTDIQLENKILYFKRELVSNNPNVLPISFAIPKEKIAASAENKEILLSSTTPGTNRNYIYEKEVDYYSSYNRAYFGLTHKRWGWDCMRHYEILANFCIPYFLNIAQCPSRTMTNFPKETIRRTNCLYEQSKDKEINKDQYFNYLNYLTTYTKEKLTTVSLAKYVLDNLIKNNVAQKEISPSSFYATIAKNFDATIHLKDNLGMGVEGFIPELWFQELNQNGTKVLEIGFGKGNFLKRVEETNKAIETFGVDCSERNLKYATEQLKLKSKLFLFDISTTKFPWETNTFSHVVLLEVLEHVLCPMQVILEIQRVLKKDAYFIYSWPEERLISGITMTENQALRSHGPGRHSFPYPGLFRYDNMRVFFNQMFFKIESEEKSDYHIFWKMKNCKLEKPHILDVVNGDYDRKNLYESIETDYKFPELVPYLNAPRNIV